MIGWGLESGRGPWRREIYKNGSCLSWEPLAYSIALIWTILTGCSRVAASGGGRTVAARHRRNNNIRRWRACRRRRPAVACTGDRRCRRRPRPRGRANNPRSCTRTSCGWPKLSGTPTDRRRPSPEVCSTITSIRRPTTVNMTFYNTYDNRTKNYRFYLLRKFLLD